MTLTLPFSPKYLNEINTYYLTNIINYGLEKIEYYIFASEGN